MESKNTELEQFAYIASHDLQEPLRTISNFTKLIWEDNKDLLNEKNSHYFQFIQEATARMRSLIESLLNYSRLGKNRKIEKLSLEQIINDVLSDLNARITETEAKIEVSEMPTMRLAGTEVRQLFQNLISNSLKFTTPDRKPIINIICNDDETHYIFEVADNGIGIEAKFFDRIFQIFQRLHTQDEIEGTGVGLANCKRIVDLHNGKIWVESDGISGSSFYFTLAKNQIEG
jgi:light-regulated signal transduction histidine kinase (bacteriophytochrome)